MEREKSPSVDFVLDKLRESLVFLVSVELSIPDIALSVIFSDVTPCSAVGYMRFWMVDSVGFLIILLDSLPDVAKVLSEILVWDSLIEEVLYRKFSTVDCEGWFNIILSTLSWLSMMVFRGSTLITHCVRVAPMGALSGSSVSSKPLFISSFISFLSPSNLFFSVSKNFSLSFFKA